MAIWKKIFSGSNPGGNLEHSLEWSPSTDPADTPVWESLTTRAREVHTRAYRQSELDEFQMGELTVVLNNRDRNVEPFQGTGRTPRRRIRWQLRHNSIVYDRFGGFVRAINVDWSKDPDATVTFTCADYGLILNQAQITISGYPEETVDDRINRVLDEIGVPAGDRAIDTSDNLCAAVPAAATGEEPQTVGGLGHASDAAKSDGGYLFQNLAGKIVFHNRRHRIDTYGTPAGTFGEDVGDIPYDRTLQGGVDDLTLWNRHAVLTAAGVREEVFDSVSASQNWESRKDDFQSLLRRPGEAAALASIVPWKYGAPNWRFPAIVPRFGNKHMTTAMIAVLLAADVGTRFAVTRQPPGGGSPINEDEHVEGIAQDAVVGQPYAMALNISPAAPALDEWIIGTSQLGVDTFIGL